MKPTGRATYTVHATCTYCTSDAGSVSCPSVGYLSPVGRLAPSPGHMSNVVCPRVAGFVASTRRGTYIRQDTDIGLAVLEVELNAIITVRKKRKSEAKAEGGDTRLERAHARRETPDATRARPGAQVGRLHSTSTPQPSNRAQHNSAHPGPLALHRKPQRNPQTRTPRRETVIKCW